MNRFSSSFKTFSEFQKALRGKNSLKTTFNFSNNNWMKNINDNKYISEISIPGTHDSCATYEPFTAIAKCQSYTITDQLNMGIRFLDLRTQFIKDKILMVHNCVIMGTNFVDVLNECIDFLKLNPTEVIILSFKTDAISIFPSKAPYKTLTELVYSSPDMWYIADKIPKIRDVRGKIVLLNRLNPKKEADKTFKEENQIGLVPENRFLEPPNEWLDNEAFLLKSKGCNYHIQDFYIFKNNDLDKKWQLIKGNLLNSSRETDFDNNLYINFLSGLSGTLPNIQKVNNFIKPKVLEFFRNNPKGTYGIIPMDFAEENLCNSIIQSNF